MQSITIIYMYYWSFEYTSFGILWDGFEKNRTEQNTTEQNALQIVIISLLLLLLIQ